MRVNQKSAMIKTKVQKNNNDDNRPEQQEFIKKVNQPIYAINYIVFFLKVTQIRNKSMFLIWMVCLSREQFFRFN